MPIDNLARRYRELGRLKFGEDLGDRPTQLTTWRLTSDQARLIEAAAAVWGGSVAYTEKGAEVILETGELEVLVPLQDLNAGQWWEYWTAGGLQRRCSGSALVEFDDGEPDGWRRVAPCVCDEENGPRLCKPTTVLRVLLPQLPDLGVWKLTTRSVYAAQELPAAVDLLLGAHPDRAAAPAVLGLDQRTSKKPGQKPRHFTVPVVRTRSTLDELAAPSTGTAGLPSQTDQAPETLPASPDNRRPPASLPAPEPGPQIPVGAPQDPPVPASLGAVGSSGASGPETGHTGDPQRSEALDALKAFLEPIDPGQLPTVTADLIALLEALESLAVDAGVWELTDDGRLPLDAAADKWLDGQDWRGGDLMTAKLRTFTQRAVLAALGRKETP